MKSAKRDRSQERQQDQVSAGAEDLGSELCGRTDRNRVKVETRGTVCLCFTEVLILPSILIND